jgi:hypothetical protein
MRHSAQLGRGRPARSVTDATGSRLVWSLSVLVVALLALCVNACGSAQKNASLATRTSTTPLLNGLKGDEDDDDTGQTIRSGTTLDKDSDSDNDNVEEKGATGFYDGDDSSVIDFGQPASPADRQVVTALVRRYYAAAVAENGSGMCELLYKYLAEVVLPEDYGTHEGPTFAHGLTTCRAILTASSKHLHSTYLAGVKVVQVRVKGDEAMIILGSPVAPASYTSAKLEDGVWKLDHTFSTSLP